MLQFNFILKLITPSVLTFRGSYQQGSRDGGLISWGYFGDTLGILWGYFGGSWRGGIAGNFSWVSLKFCRSYFKHA